jgi:hypothetical protein
MHTMSLYHAAGRQAAAGQLRQRTAAAAPQHQQQRQQRRCVRVFAKASSSSTKRKGNVGFRWNPAQNRWERDDRWVVVGWLVAVAATQPPT